MKKIFSRGIGYSFYGWMLIMMVAFFMVTCSKDNSLTGNYAKAVVLPGEPPVAAVGSIKGYTYPVSQNASFKIFNEEGASFACTINKDGSFLLENIPEGSYEMVIFYQVNRADNNYFTDYNAGTVRVLTNTVTSLGQIDLPWTW
jgi:hypothetical protein